MVKDLIGGSLGFGVGGSVIARLPKTGATPGIQKGLATGVSFIPAMVNIKAGGLAVKGLRNLNPKDKKRLKSLY